MREIGVDIAAATTAERLGRENRRLWRLLTVNWRRLSPGRPDQNPVRLPQLTLFASAGIAVAMITGVHGSRHRLSPDS